MFWVCRVFNLFGDYLVLVYIIYIYKVYLPFSKGWVVSLDYGTTAIVALLSGQLQVIAFINLSIKLPLFVFTNSDDVWSKGTVQQMDFLCWFNDDC